MAADQKTMFRFTIRDVLWLTLCVAMFFGGRYWDQVARLATAPRTPPAAVGTSLRLSRGGSGTVSTFTHDRLTVSDPSLISVTPVTPTKFLVTAKAKGAAKVTVWEQGSGRQFTFDVLVYP